MTGRSAREMAEAVSRARRRQLYRWWRRWSVRVPVAFLLLALGVVIGITLFPLLPAETRDIVERLMGS